MTEFTVQFPLTVRLGKFPGSELPHSIGAYDLGGQWQPFTRTNDVQLKRVGIAKPTPTLRRGDVLRDNQFGLCLIVNDPVWRDDWHDYYTIVAHVDIDALDEVTP